MSGFFYSVLLLLLFHTFLLPFRWYPLSTCVRWVTVHLPYLFISQYLLFKLGTALHDLGTLRGNEFLTKPRSADIQVTATLTVARYEQLCHWGAIASECLGVWETAHGSDDE